MSNESNTLNQAVTEMKKLYDKDTQRANYKLDTTIASDAEIKASGDFTQGIWNAFVAKAANPECYSATIFMDRLKKLVEETGWPYESITVYMSLAYPSYPTYTVIDSNKVLYSGANAQGNNDPNAGWVYSAFLTFKTR
jgi:hypothetical protein